MSFSRWARQTREWNCEVFDAKSTRWCSSSISHDVICIPGTARYRYVIRNQPHDVIHAETERPSEKKKQTSVWVMNESSWRDRSRMICTWNDTRNCMVCDWKSDRPSCFVLRQGPSMPRRNWSIWREEPSISPTTVPPRTSSSCCLSLIKEASYTYSAEVPLLHTPVEVRFSIICRVDGQRALPLDHVQVAACACGLAWVVTGAPGTSRRRPPHTVLVLLYGYQNITLPGK